eukprot:6464911-Amphidinium_carterae.1
MLIVFQGADFSRALRGGYIRSGRSEASYRRDSDCPCHLVSVRDIALDSDTHGRVCDIALDSDMFAGNTRSLPFWSEGAGIDIGTHMLSDLVHGMQCALVGTMISPTWHWNIRAAKHEHLPGSPPLAWLNFWSLAYCSMSCAPYLLGVSVLPEWSESCAHLTSTHCVTCTCIARFGLTDGNPSPVLRGGMNDQDIDFSAEDAPPPIKEDDLLALSRESQKDEPSSVDVQPLQDATVDP